MLRSYALLSILLASAVAPLHCDELYDNKPVSHIEIVIDSSDGYFDAKPALAKLATQEGDPFSQVIFDKDLKSLSEEYERVEPSVQLKNGQVVIVIRVSPKPIIHAIDWEGNTQFSNSTLREELGIQPNTLFNRADFNKAFNKVKEFYFKKGYFESQLSYTVQPIEGTNQVDILIEVNEGRPGYIKEIDFVGFTKEEQSELSDQIYLKKYHFLTSWLTGTGIFRDEAVEQDRMTILTYLQNKGYADAKVDVNLSDDPESGKILVEIVAHRGQLYHFGKVDFQGNTLFSVEELEKKSTVAAGGVYSPEKIRDTAQAIKDMYGQKGYIDASVQYETPLSENDPIFDVHFAIEEGQEYKVGIIHVFGNCSTQSSVILRESLLVPGETFDARKLKATQQRLEAVGYFKSVNVYAVRSSDDENLGENYRDVYIEVEEKSTGSASLFMGFSSTDDVYGGLDLTEQNFNIAGFYTPAKGCGSRFRGGGEFLHLRGTLGQSQNNVLVSWMQPYFFDSLWRFGVELSRTGSQLQNDTNVITYGGSVTASYPLSNFWAAGMRQRLRHAKDNLYIDPYDNSQRASDSVRQQKNLLDQDGLVSAFSGNINYDSTDNAYKPHRGWRSYFETEVAGIGGSYDFVKFSYLNSLYFPLWTKATFRLRGDFRFIVPFGKTSVQTVPYSERLMLGGETTVRAYKPFLLGPVVQIQDGAGNEHNTSTPQGGISSGMLSLEINQEIFKMLDVFAFFDVGTVTLGTFQLHDIRPTAGGGVRIDIGNRNPIMFGWGAPLVRADRHNGKWQKFFFAMGGQF